MVHPVPCRWFDCTRSAALHATASSNTQVSLARCFPDSISTLHRSSHILYRRAHLSMPRRNFVEGLPEIMEVVDCLFLRGRGLGKGLVIIAVGRLFGARSCSWKSCLRSELHCIVHQDPVSPRVDPRCCDCDQVLFAVGQCAYLLVSGRHLLRKVLYSS